MVAHSAGDLNDALHIRDGFFDLVVQGFFHFGDLQEMERQIFFFHALFHVGVHHFSDERGVRGHQDVHLVDHLEKDVQGHEPVLSVGFAFESGTVESHIPVGQIFKESQQLGDHGVETVLFHLYTDQVDQVLGTGLDPLIHIVGHLFLLLEGEFGVFGGLITLDILDQEAICVVPGEEHVSNDRFDPFLLEVQGLGSHQGRIGEVNTDSISSVLINHLPRVGVIFKTFGHLLAVTGQHQTIHN